MLKKYPFHPLIWTVYPIVALVSLNIQQMQLLLAARSLALALLGAALLFVLLRLALRDWHKAALLTTLCAALFFSYGHIYSFLEGVAPFGINLARHSLMIVVWLLLLALGAFWIIRTRRDLGSFTQALNLIGLLALVIALIQVVPYEINRASQGGSAKSPAAGSSPSGLSDSLVTLKTPAGSQPDIYYIILDAYARDDTLQKYFNYDNGPFLDGLEQAGFYVARCSQSNYSHTQLSLASSLNMNYLDALGISQDKLDDQPALNELILHNQTRQALEKLGYKTVVVESGFSPTDWDDAAEFLTGSKEPGVEAFTGGVNPFEALLLRTSGGALIYKAYPYLPKSVRSFLDAAYTERRNRITYALDELDEISAISGPKFVFAHILAPHEPFVFGPQGQVVSRSTPFTLNGDLEYRDPSKYTKGYRDQVIYLNSQVLPLLKSIISRSNTPPVIIIQGDHGALPRASSSAARMTILNAYYFPAAGQNLYAAITPVNSFRLLFNTYFGGSLPLLQDTSYFSDKGGKLTAMPNQRQDCGASITK